MIWKRIFDLLLSCFLLFILFVPMIFVWFITSLHYKSNGLFLQTRIGQFGKPFVMYKIKTLSTYKQSRTKWGDFLRASKIDEIPQLINVIKGDMSIVGPRPDVEGYYDLLEGENKILLNLKPGLTSEAALKYFNEEKILSSKKQSKIYNNNVIFPDKIKMNLHYYQRRSLLVDLKIILKTIAVYIKRKI